MARPMTTTKKGSPDDVSPTSTMEEAEGRADRKTQAETTNGEAQQQPGSVGTSACHAAAEEGTFKVHTIPTNPLKQGIALQRMKAEQKLSNRKLAAQVSIPETTLRSYLDYAKAFELRNSSAPQMAAADIERLTIKQVKQYLSLPAGERDAWLAAGAKLNESKSQSAGDKNGHRKGQAMTKSSATGELVSVDHTSPTTTTEEMEGGADREARTETANGEVQEHPESVRAPASPSAGGDSPITIRMIPISLIDPNDFNSNELTPEETEKYVAEVSSRRRLLDLIAVRPKGERYEVITREHSLKAAKAYGMAEVPC
jgi:hypothetical protein